MINNKNAEKLFQKAAEETLSKVRLDGMRVSLAPC